MSVTRTNPYITSYRPGSGGVFLSEDEIADLHYCTEPPLADLLALFARIMSSIVGAKNGSFLKGIGRLIKDSGEKVGASADAQELIEQATDGELAAWGATQKAGMNYAPGARNVFRR